MRSLLHAPRTRGRSVAAATLGALALIGSLLVSTPAQALNDTGTGGVFVASTGRILDTKSGTGGFSTPMEAGQFRTIKVAGLAGLPDDGSVGAVSLNATVGASSGYGTLVGRPSADAGRTTMLIYNGVSGEYTSNTATLAVGSDGTIQVMTETSARLILDVQGYYTANTDGTAAGGFVPVAKRIVDTRSGTGAVKAAIAPGKSIDVQVTGSNGVPTGASGAVVNLIALNGTATDGYLTPYATGGTKPANSLHYAPSENTSIQAQVPLSADGKMTIANSSTTANLVVDLQGYFTAAGKSGAMFTPSYGRAYDSRATGNTALGEQETRSIQIAGTAGVPVMGSGITAVVLTLIVAHGGGDGFADVYADGKTNPGITAINFNAGEIQTNTITVPLGANGKIALRNAAKATNYVVDVQGWYADPQAPKLACDAPYTPNSWSAMVPDAINCTVTAAPTPESGYTVDLTDNDVSMSELELSDTTTTSITSLVVPFGGVNTLSAALLDDDGNRLATTSYQLGFGDWATRDQQATPTSGMTLTTTPTLSVQPTDDYYGDGDSVRFSVSENSDGVSAPVISSTDGASDWDIPAGSLQSGHTYYWTATITGPSGASQQNATVTTAPSSFIASDSEPEPTITAVSNDDADAASTTTSPGQTQVMTTANYTRTTEYTVQLAKAKQQPHDTYIANSWNDVNGKTVYLRNNAWYKIRDKHNLSIKAVRVSTQYPDSKNREAAGSPNYVYLATFQERSSRGRLIHQQVVRTIVSFRDYEWGGTKGVISSYCPPIQGKCPSWIKETVG